MSSRAPGSGSRGRGGKFNKTKRGGGKQFSRDLQPVDDSGNAVSMWSEEAQNRSSDDDSGSDDESGDEAPHAAAGPSSSSAAAADASREDRKAQKKARKEAAKSKAHKVEVGDMPSSEDESSDDDDDDNINNKSNNNKGGAAAPANPNHSTAARKQTSRPATVDDITEGVKKMPGNRREREAAEAAAAKERYMQLSAQGKTDTAKADLARLKLIREQREAEAARRQAEKEERDEQDSRRRAEIEAREAKRREAAAGPAKKTVKKK